MAAANLCSGFFNRAISYICESAQMKDSKIGYVYEKNKQLLTIYKKYYIIITTNTENGIKKERGNLPCAKHFPSSFAL